MGQRDAIVSTLLSRTKAIRVRRRGSTRSAPRPFQAIQAAEAARATPDLQKHLDRLGRLPELEADVPHPPSAAIPPQTAHSGALILKPSSNSARANSQKGRGLA
jgi:hypothetical protein